MPGGQNRPPGRPRALPLVHCQIGLHCHTLLYQGVCAGVLAHGGDTCRVGETAARDGVGDDVIAGTAAIRAAAHPANCTVSGSHGCKHLTARGVSAQAAITVTATAARALPTSASCSAAGTDCTVTGRRTAIAGRCGRAAVGRTAIRRTAAGTARCIGSGCATGITAGCTGPSRRSSAG